MRRTLLTIVAALTLLSGCAGDKDDGDGVATAGDATTSANADKADDAANAAKYAQCMRDNGIDMPDPQVDDGKVIFGGPAGSAEEPIDRTKVDAAQQKCKQYLPNGGEPPKVSEEDLAKMRKFSQCMRENGFPDFPDPQPDGGIRVEGGQNMDPGSQKWKDAHKKCEEFMPARKEGGEAGNGGGS